MKLEQTLKQGQSVLNSWCICDRNNDGSYFVEVADSTDRDVADIYEPAMPEAELLKIASALDTYFIELTVPKTPGMTVTDVYINHPEFEDTIAIGDIAVMSRRYAKMLHQTLRRMFGKTSKK